MPSLLVSWLQDVEEDQLGLVGGKGLNLGRLLRLDMPVPPGFVITTEAYRAFLAANHLADAGPEELRRRISNAPIPADISIAILEGYQRLETASVAVRSSGTAEDLASASFAGQHDTFLNVSGEQELLDAVRACWASLWSLRAIEYRQHRGWDDRDLALAVVVQAMVQSEWAGVLFTADPVTGHRDRLVVEAVAGLGEALVSGQAAGNRSLIEKSGLRLLAGDPLVPRQALEELARLAMQVETVFGQPQDIEWAYASGRCYLLQARPLTALPSEVHWIASEEARRYSRLQRLMAPNAMDHMPLAPYPFDYSLFFRPGMERTLEALRGLGLSMSAVDDAFLEVAEGVVQEVPPVVRLTPRALKLPMKLPAALRARHESWLEECRTRLVAPAQRIDGEDLSALSEQELLGRIETLQAVQVELLVSRFEYLLPGLLVSQLLTLLLRLAVGRQARALERDLLAAVPCVTTAANRELGRLARRIRAVTELRQVFLEAEPERVVAQLSASAAGRGLLDELDAFLQRYGYRESAMPSAALPAWRDNPSIVYGLLKALVTGEQETSALDAGDEQRVERARRTVVAALSAGWLGVGRRFLLPLFPRLLDGARAFIAFREDSHYFLLMACPVVRRLALDLGRRLAERGVLEEADDIFFLEIEEIKGLGSAAGVRDIVRKRRGARRSVEGRYTAVPVELLEQTGRAGEVRGAAASPGQTVGPVRIILSERDFSKLQQGEVLVAPYTNPAWTPLFALASAVVVDAGSVASDAAIVAREYGIPAVMGTGTATRALRDGQRVLVNGDKGRVVPIVDSRNH